MEMSSCKQTNKWYVYDNLWGSNGNIKTQASCGGEGVCSAPWAPSPLFFRALASHWTAWWSPGLFLPCNLLVPQFSATTPPHEPRNSLPQGAEARKTVELETIWAQLLMSSFFSTSLKVVLKMYFTDLTAPHRVFSCSWGMNTFVLLPPFLCMCVGRMVRLPY